MHKIRVASFKSSEAQVTVDVPSIINILGSPRSCVIKFPMINYLIRWRLVEFRFGLYWIFWE